MSHQTERFTQPINGDRRFPREGLPGERSRRSMYHAKPRLTNITFLAFDTETIGLPNYSAAGRSRRRALSPRRCELLLSKQLIDPNIPILQKFSSVHGITDAMVRGKPAIEHVLPQFIEFLGHPDTILLAHNAPFDLAFLAMALIRLGIAYSPHNIFDTLDIARRLYPAWPGHSLEHVASRLNVANKAEHRALSDARWSRTCFWRCCNTLPPSEQALT